MKKIIILSVFLTGCSFTQPSSKTTPVADSIIGGVLYTSAVVSLTESEQALPENKHKYIESATWTTVIGSVFLASAVYGFSRKSSLKTDEPFWLWKPLGIALQGMADGMRHHNNFQGCCAYHGGLAENVCDSITNRVVCVDDTLSPTCRCY